MNFQTLQTALEAIEQAELEIITVEATDANQAILDAAYRGLLMASENIAKLLEPIDDENRCRAIID